MEEDARLDQELLAMHDDLKRERKSKLRSMHQSQGSSKHDGDDLDGSSPGVGDHREGLEAALGSARTAAKDSVGEERTQRAGSVPGDTDAAEVNTNYGNADGEFASNSVHLGSGKASRNLPGELGALHSAGAQTSQRSPRELAMYNNNSQLGSPPQPGQVIIGKRYTDHEHAQELQSQQAHGLLISGQRASLSPPNRSKQVAPPRGIGYVNLKRRPQAEDAAVSAISDPAVETMAPHQERASLLPRAETTAFNARPGFKGSRKHARPKLLNL